MKIPTTNKYMKSNHRNLSWKQMHLNSLYQFVLYLSYICMSPRPHIRLPLAHRNNRYSVIDLIDILHIQVYLRRQRLSRGRWCICLNLTCHVAEISKWLEVHFSMSKISKDKIPKLSLVSKSDVFNVQTSNRCKKVRHGLYFL